MVRAGWRSCENWSGVCIADISRRPKCWSCGEDTSVTPLVEDDLKAAGVAGTRKSARGLNRKGDLPEAEWAQLRERLFPTWTRTRIRAWSSSVVDAAQGST